jgi:hypothetical protein
MIFPVLVHHLPGKIAMRYIYILRKYAAVLSTPALND